MAANFDNFMHTKTYNAFSFNIQEAKKLVQIAKFAQEIRNKRQQ